MTVPQGRRFSADGGHGGSEEGFEVVGGPGVLGDGGFDGLLGYGPGVAEVDEGGEGVVSGGAAVGASSGCGDGYGEVVQLVLEFEDYALGGLLAYAGDPGEGGVVGGDATQDGDGQLGAYAGDGQELLEEALLLGLVEAEEGYLVFADVGVDVEGRFGAVGRKSGEGGDADGDVVAYAGALDDGLVGGFREEASAEVGNHAWVIVLGGATADWHL